MQEQHSSEQGIKDFDFFIGHWRVENRRLQKRLKDNHDWETFEATQTVHQLPGGIGNYDDYLAPAWRPGFVGMSLRLFNPQTQLWSIYWLDNNTAGLNEAGSLMPPVVGKFTDGVGTFECADTLGDRPILVRYTWSAITPNGALWEQRMSADNGQSWEMNWQMRMHRLA